MRIRQIKPEFWKDDEVADLTRDQRLLFIGMWNLADGWGILEDKPRWIRAELFPYDRDLEDAMIASLIEALIDRGFVIRYTHNSDRLLFIPNFRRHQKHGMHEKERDKITDRLPPGFEMSSLEPAPVMTKITTKKASKKKEKSAAQDTQKEDENTPQDPPGTLPRNSPRGSRLHDQEGPSHGMGTLPGPSRAQGGDSGCMAVLVNGVMGEGEEERASAGAAPPPPAGPDGATGERRDGEGDGTPANLVPLVERWPQTRRTLREFVVEFRDRSEAEVREIIAELVGPVEYVSQIKPAHAAWSKRKRDEAEQDMRDRVVVRSHATAKRICELISENPELITSAKRPHCIRDGVVLLSGLIETGRDCTPEITYLTSELPEELWTKVRREHRVKTNVAGGAS